MYARFSLSDTAQMNRWDQFVRSHPEGTPFHTSGWLDCIRKTYRYKPILYAFYDENNRIDGIFPCFHIDSFITGNRLVSIPFSDYGGPLFTSREKICGRLAAVIERMPKDCRCLEIRADIGEQGRFKVLNDFIQHVIELNPDPDAVLRRMNRKTTRRCIRKAGRFGVKIDRGNTPGGIREFYRLNILTRKKHGMPPQPFGFFENLYENLIAGKDAFILLAQYQGKTLAAGLFIRFRKTLYFKYNASDPEYLGSISPNHLLTWHAIKEACLNGYEYFDFGRTSSSNAGLVRYKEMWGARPLPLPYFYYPGNNALKPDTENELSYRLFTRVCRHLPVQILTVFGSIIYRHIG